MSAAVKELLESSAYNGPLHFKKGSVVGQGPLHGTLADAVDALGDALYELEWSCRQLGAQVDRAMILDAARSALARSMAHPTRIALPAVEVLVHAGEDVVPQQAP